MNAETIRCVMLNVASALCWPMLRVLPLLRLAVHGLPLSAVFAAHQAMGLYPYPGKSRGAHDRHEGGSSKPEQASDQSSSSPDSAALLAAVQELLNQQSDHSLEAWDEVSKAP
jgi:hypothetical protein